MNLWLAVDLDLKSLGVETANTSEQAYYQFMERSIYPDRLIKLPKYLVTRDYMDEQIEFYCDGD